MKHCPALFVPALWGGLALSEPAAWGAPAPLPRPPQLVAIAFDNCTELSWWKDTEAFLDELSAAGVRVRLTFFLSGVNFLTDDHREKYQGPRQKSGVANIAFGGNREEVQERILVINRLHAAGHEMASHAVGHFYGGQGRCSPSDRPGRQCGADWTVAEWSQELESFRTLLDAVVANNGLTGPGFAFPAGKITGFRAPQLSVNPAMLQALKAEGFTYDASFPSGAAPDAWPERGAAGLWLIKLARIAIPGVLDQGRPATNLSMDYNICASQMRGMGKGSCETALPDPREREKLGEQMMAAYTNYFHNNYYGGRAPITIGHHFYPYQEGVYNKTLFAFVRETCGLPEVRCVSFGELVKFLERQDAQTLQAYRKGGFIRKERPAADRSP